MTAHLGLLLGGPTTSHLSIASAAPADPETLLVSIDQRLIQPSLLVDEHGSRLHRVEADQGVLIIDYAATVTGRAAPALVRPLELLAFVRPSGHCESDILAPTAHAVFARLEGHTLLSAVSAWVHERITYVPGSCEPTDGAVETLLTRAGGDAATSRTSPSPCSGPATCRPGWHRSTPRPLPDGFPRGVRGLCRGGLVRRRRDLARPASVAAADRDRA